MKNRTGWKTLATACVVVAVFLAVGGMSWGQTNTNTAVVHFKLTGLTTASGPLAATANPVKTSRCLPPAVVTVTGGRPPYAVSSQSSFFGIAQRDASTFTVTSLRNATGRIIITVTDAANTSTQVTILAYLCFK
jgi:hypothetical protein